MSAPKLCIDCKHFADREGAPEYGKCHSPKNDISKKSLIDGVAKQEFRQPYAQEQRRAAQIVAVFFGYCGKRGRWFEQK